MLSLVVFVIIEIIKTRFLSNYYSYFPNVDLGWWLFAVTIGIGSIGVVVGGIVSDKIVKKMGVRSRVLVLALSQLISTPGAFGSVYFDPFWAMVSLATSYFFAEMWFGIVFAVIVEIVPMEFRSSVVGVFMFVINNIGGNLPILVDPLAKLIGYRESISIFYAGFYLISESWKFQTYFTSRIQISDIFHLCFKVRYFSSSQCTLSKESRHHNRLQNLSRAIEMLEHHSKLESTIEVTFLTQWQCHRLMETAENRMKIDIKSSKWTHLILLNLESLLIEIIRFILNLLFFILIEQKIKLKKI